MRRAYRQQSPITRWVAALLLALLASWMTAAWALDPDKSFRHFVFDRWSIEDGLPQLSVLSIAQDNTGYLWLTTQNGIARFDGVRFRVYTIENTPQLRANIVDRVHLAPDGSLWFGSSRGLTRFHDNQWTTLDLIADHDVAVSAMLNDDRSGMLVATDQGVFRVEGGTATRYALDGIPVRALTRVGYTLYAGGNGVVYEQRAGHRRELPLPGGGDAPAVNALLSAPDGIFAATRRGLYRLVDDRWDIPAWAQALSQSRIESMFRDNDGNLWIGTTEGLYRYHSRRGLERCLTPALEGTAWIASFYEDREGNLWIGSLTHSLSRLWNGWASRMSVVDGLSDPFVWSVVADDDQNLWIGTNTGIEQLAPDGSLRLITSTRQLPDPSVYNLFRTQAGELLIGTRAGMAIWDGQALQRDPIWEPLAQASIRTVVETGPKQYWIGTSQGLYRQLNQELKLIGPEYGLQEPRVRALLQTQRDELWVGTERGLYLGVEDRFERMNEPPPLARALVTAVVPWRGSRVVVTSMDAGLFVGNPGNFRQITTENGLPYNSAFAAIADAGWLYVTSPEGVYRIALGDLERFYLEGGRLMADMVIQTGGQHPGALRSRCCNGGAQARVARMNGNVWLPTLDGVLRMDTGRIRRSSLSPPAVIESIEHLGKAYEHGNHLQLDGSSGDIAVAYSGLALQDPTGLRFRYRLLGYDDRWRAAGDRRIAYYTNLAPGSYRFETIATSSAGLDSPSAASLEFVLVPPFYRALWFQWLIVLMLLALSVLGWLAYRRRQLSRERYLESLIQQRTADLDRANERLRSANRALVEESHTDALTGLRNRRFLAHFMADWRRTRNGGRPQRLAFVLIDLDHFKRVNDLHGHLAGDEVLRQVAAVLTEIAGQDGIPLRWGGEEFMLVLPAESIADAAHYCEQLRGSIAAQRFVHSGESHTQLTASIGYALFPALADRSDADDWNLSLELADAALYLIKSGARNGWAIVHARAHARTADFGGGFSGRLRELSSAGLVFIESSVRAKASDSRPPRPTHPPVAD